MQSQSGKYGMLKERELEHEIEYLIVFFNRKNLILQLIFNLMVNFQIYKVKIAIS